MLIKNGKLVDLKTDPEFVRFKKNELLALPDPVRFRSPRELVRNPSGLMEALPVFNINFKSSIQTEDGLEEWAYTKTLKRDKDNGDYLPAKKAEIVHWDLPVAHRDADLIYFLLHKSVQTNNSFVVEDKTKAAQKRAEGKSLEAELQAALYTKASPLTDEGLLRQVAAAWGVTQADEKHPAILKEELETRIRANEKQKGVDPSAWGIKEFLEKISSTEELQKRSIAQKALDKNIVRYNEMSFYYEIGESGDKLLLVPSTDLGKKEEYFIRECARDTEGVWKIIKKAIITPEMIDSWKDPKQYGWLVAEEGLPQTMKKADKIAKLKEIYS